MVSVNFRNVNVPLVPVQVNFRNFSSKDASLAVDLPLKGPLENKCHQQLQTSFKCKKLFDSNLKFPTMGRFKCALKKYLL